MKSDGWNACLEALQPSNLHGNDEEVVELDRFINVTRMLVNGVLETPPWLFLQGLHSSLTRDIHSQIFIWTVGGGEKVSFWCRQSKEPVAYHGGSGWCGSHVNLLSVVGFDQTPRIMLRRIWRACLAQQRSAIGLNNIDYSGADCLSIWHESLEDDCFVLCGKNNRRNFSFPKCFQNPVFLFLACCSDSELVRDGDPGDIKCHWRGQSFEASAF